MLRVGVRQFPNPHFSTRELEERKVSLEIKTNTVEAKDE
jgi:hypothetical protein